MQLNGLQCLVSTFLAVKLQSFGLKADQRLSQLLLKNPVVYYLPYKVEEAFLSSILWNNYRRVLMLLFDFIQLVTDRLTIWFELCHVIGGSTMHSYMQQILSFIEHLTHISYSKASQSRYLGQVGSFVITAVLRFFMFC